MYYFGKVNNQYTQEMEIIQLNLLVCDALNIMMQYLSFRLHVTVELTSDGLLTASRMTVRSRQSSAWRTTCLSAACCNSSSWMSRQSGESQGFSHWPEGGSKTQIYNAESFYFKRNAVHYSNRGYIIDLLSRQLLLGFNRFKIFQNENTCLLLVNTIPASVADVLFIFVLMIMSGIGWGGAQSHMRHADNKVIRWGLFFFAWLQQ